MSCRSSASLEEELEVEDNSGQKKTKKLKKKKGKENKCRKVKKLENIKKGEMGFGCGPTEKDVFLGWFN